VHKQKPHQIRKEKGRCKNKSRTKSEKKKARANSKSHTVILCYKVPRVM